MVKRYHKLTPRTLEHILLWGDVACKSHVWTKSDIRTYALVKKEIRCLQREQYQKQERIKVNPSLNPKQPYHTT